MARSRLLVDAFCCAGGATKGYQRAGFTVIGVDCEPQPHYCGDEFIQMDALEYLALIQAFRVKVDAVHASPPCQDWSALASVTGGNGTGWLLEATLPILRRLPCPWVCENVVGAPLPRTDNLFGDYGVELCGTMFGLQVLRHRLFQTSFPVVPPEHGSHDGEFYSPAGHGDPSWSRRERDPKFKGKGYAARCAAAMGIDWMNRDELAQAIPPAYTEWLGARMMEQLEVAA